MTYRDTVEVGSTVQVGAGGDPYRHMTWTVTGLRPNGDGITYATVRSGSSGQTRTYPIDRLRLFRITEENNA